MYISGVKIRNYRSLKAVDLNFHEGKNVIVGKNNSGKSNIIKAIDLVVGEKYPTYQTFDMNDFYAEKNDESELSHSSSFTIILELKHGFSDELSYCEEELLGYTRSIPFFTHRHVPIINPGTNDINDVFLYYDGKYVKGAPNYIQNDWCTASNMSKMLSDKANTISIYLHVVREGHEFIRYFGIILQKGPICHFIYAINNNLRNCLLTSVIIPAIRSPYSNLKINNYSWYSKLLKERWHTGSQDAQKELLALNDQVKLEANNLFAPVMNDISDLISKTINAKSVNFRLLNNNSADMYKTASIYVDDGFETELEHKGTGTQSVVIISLFAHYCKSMHKSGSLLAIEEPECYLHPHARRALSSSFDYFIRDDKSDKPNNQIILTTHSPDFLRNTPMENIQIIRKNSQTGESYVVSIPKDDSSISGYKQKIEKIINLKHAEMLFADCVILVEGGEEHLIPLIADLEKKEGQPENPLDKYNISVVNVGGKSNFIVYIKLLEKLGINYYVIADFDYLYAGKDILKLKPETEILKLDVPISESNVKPRNKLLESVRDSITELSSEPDKTKIRERITDPSSYDGQNLFKAIDMACINNEVGPGLIDVWEFLKGKYTKPKINLSIILESENEVLIHFVETILKALNENEHLYILRKGELEDYYTQEGLKIPGGKEIKAIGIADEVYMNWAKGNTIEKYLDITEYRTIIQRAIRDCQISSS